MADDFLTPTPGGDAQRVRVDALGEPGNRRFRLLAAVAGETHILWMEKQQLQALGLAIEQMLEQLPEGQSLVDESALPVEFDDQTRSQFRVGRMELGFDIAADRIIIAAHDLQQEESDPRPSLNVRVTRNQALEISTDAAVVVAAGRPRCPMCGSLMTPGEHHVCPEQNGHLPLSIDDDEFLA
ncbi:MAG TPA: DUF3090 family protein [Thermomicrobiales bacterium]|nr:DUF3090 family protein [Thermomicrobiales bacterium]